MSAAQLYRLHLLSVLTPVHAFNQLTRLLPEQRAWRQFAHLSNRQETPDVWMLHQFRQRCGAGGLRRINQHLLEPMLPPVPAGFTSVGLIDATDLPAACSGHKKKESARYSARDAAIGARSVKCGQGRFYVGYKKHTLRLWLPHYSSGVLLVPLVSWVAPANLVDGRFLRPSLAYCQSKLRWRPDIVVGDMGYIDSRNARRIRRQWQVAVVTRLKPSMLLVKPFESAHQAVCDQGQVLQWLGYEERDDLHWFGATEADSLCPRCWQASQCPRQFSHRPEEHETLLGLIPMNTRVSQRLLFQVRPWIEPAQSYEKNQLGLSEVFLNSLGLAWTMSLLADAAVLLRARALLETPSALPPLAPLMPSQLPLDLSL